MSVAFIGENGQRLRWDEKSGKWVDPGDEAVDEAVDKAVLDKKPEPELDIF